MDAPSGQLVDQPAVDGPERKIAPLGALPRTFHVIQNPLDLGPREVGINDESRTLADQGLEASLLQFLADRRALARLPDDCTVNRLSLIHI